VTRPPVPPRLIAAVALGGAVGALLRWSVGELTPSPEGFPWPTFAVNLTGCFALALLPALAVVRERQALAVGLGPGLLGGYTTLSAYAEESRALLDAGRPGTAGLYLAGTFAACLAAAALAGRFSTVEDLARFHDEEGDE
jgi:CrcB protein